MTSIAELAPKVEVNQRIPLRTYYRIADSLLRQAQIYRNEGNRVELYIMLLRFTSLVTDTIPSHSDHKRATDKQRTALKKKAYAAVIELESLKPYVVSEWKAVKTRREPIEKKDELSFKYDPEDTADQYRSSWPALEFRPRDDTLSRHSYFTYQQPTDSRKVIDVSTRVKYPSDIQHSSVDIPSLDENWSCAPLRTERRHDSFEVLSQYDLVNQLAPPPSEVPVQTMSHTVPPRPVADPRPGPPELSEGGPKHLHVSTRMMEEFLAMAKANTVKNLETCAVLAGMLEKGIFSVTTLIIPKQEATSDSCQTVNEEELFEIQDQRNLFQLGWIHTHPSQTCFMSSIDLHTHYSYQVMLKEAIAIVMAPTDEERTFGIFRLSEPEGMKTIQQCDQRGFHPHDEPDDGSSIYDHCSHVYMNPNLKFDIVDLR